MIKFNSLQQEHINGIFNKHSFKCIPLSYIDFVKVEYDNNIVQRYNRAQISNKINEMDINYMTLYSVYNDSNIVDIQISLRHDKILEDVNSRLTNWFDEVVQEAKSEDY